VNTVVLGLVIAPAAVAQDSTGGAGYDSPKRSRQPTSTSTSTSASPRTTVPYQYVGPAATIGPDGLAIAPAEAPLEVQNAIAAGNRIIGLPYKYGGGHANVEDSGYDCSGTVSYALIGGGLIADGVPLDSSGFMRWGDVGPGQWITVYTNPGHAYVVIAGLRLDTSAAADPSGDRGPRWRPALRSTRGFRARHPIGF
jgi:hypothetical protein